MINSTVQKELTAWATYKAYIIAKLKEMRGTKGRNWWFAGDAESRRLFALWYAARRERQALTMPS